MRTSLHNGKPVPTITVELWNKMLAAIAGRDLTEAEKQRADKMADHNWTLRVVATDLFGAARADAHFMPADATPERKSEA